MTTGNGKSETVRERAGSGPRTATVRLPFVTAEFRAPQVRMPRVPVPDRREINAAVRTARSYLPSRKQALYFGGLAVAAAFEVIEWPVAAAIGLGAAFLGREGERRESTEETRTAERRSASGSSARSSPTRRRSGATARPGSERA